MSRFTAIPLDEEPGEDCAVEEEPHFGCPHSYADGVMGLLIDKGVREQRFRVARRK